MASSNTPIIQWLVDTRHLWPQAAKTKDLEQAAPRALAILTPEERAGVLKYFFVRDAKMSLASHLLKHYVLARTLGIPWSATKLTRDANKKPVYVGDDGQQPCRFNVSHQAGLVALVASVSKEAEVEADVGVDIVCVSERRDRDQRMVQDEGWGYFVDMHSDVFGRGETAYLKSREFAAAASASVSAASGGAAPTTSEKVADAKLRRFYALWCLREAYVKMTGEALLAPWLGDLNFVEVRAPEPVTAEGGAFQQGADGSGEVITTHEVTFEGQRVDDANICLRSLGPDYMLGTAVRTPKNKDIGLGWHLGAFEIVDVETIVQFVEAEGSA
ncbi:4'-phosphopantetheinyl transferase NpgA [Apiospora rasikravindrae]|uniref:holo-[acyl-carrier-protein] synthase n=1 Tax=Apiospora rasikravindrae TaxID=990691 RepID=A0ABR1RNH0_9PEZI